MPLPLRQSVIAAPLQARTIAQQNFSSPAIYSTRQAVLLLFRESMPWQCLMPADLSHAEWRRLLHWLDISGLALYFLERIRQLELCDTLPPSVITRLEQNQADNTARTMCMMAESARLQIAFQSEDVGYAVLKGSSLWPESVQKLELRHQFDLDFLVHAESADRARGILLHQGYRLHAQSGRSLEFKRDEHPAISMRNFYKVQPGHSVELHIEPSGDESSSKLARTKLRRFAQMDMPVLSPVDLFVGQGLHVYKNICSEFCRASHLLEFRHHILSRRDDVAFWQTLETAVGFETRASIGLGTAVIFITEIMGDFAPEALTRWTVDLLPASVKLWSRMYAKRAAFADVPGTKLYLLLQAELELAGLPGKRSAAKALLPSCLPPMVSRAAAKESISRRLKRYCLQTGILAARSRFHVIEGLRYAYELRRWRRHLRKLIS